MNFQIRYSDHGLLFARGTKPDNYLVGGVYSEYGDIAFLSKEIDNNSKTLKKSFPGCLASFLSRNDKFSSTFALLG